MQERKGTMTPSSIETAAQALTAAYRNREPLTALPAHCRPGNLEDAYAIQAAYADISGSAVSGYKIGAASKQSQKLVGASGPFLARIFAGTTFSSPAQISDGLFSTPAVEAELAFRIGRDMEPRLAPYSREEIATAIDTVYPAIEICDNRFVDWRTVDLLQIIADNGFYGALVTGDPIINWRGLDLAQTYAAVSINGAVLEEGVCGPVLAHPVSGVAWIANELSKQSIGLKRGQIIAIGTWTGLHFLKSGSKAVVDFGPFGTIRIDFS
jgi:2-keto-4-pentenoate hydratase